MRRLLPPAPPSRGSADGHRLGRADDQEGGGVSNPREDASTLAGTPPPEPDVELRERIRSYALEQAGQGRRAYIARLYQLWEK